MNGVATVVSCSVGTRVEGFNCQAVPEVESVHNDEEAPERFGVHVEWLKV